MRNRFPIIVLVAALQLGCAGPAGDAANTGERSLEHFNPIVLNEYAVERAQAGDVKSAWILLERAARLAPYDERIVRNLEVIRAYREGKELPPVKPSESGAAEQGAVSADGGDADQFKPPPIWPLQ